MYENALYLSFLNEVERWNYNLCKELWEKGV